MSRRARAPPPAREWLGAGEDVDGAPGTATLPDVASAAVPTPRTAAALAPAMTSVRSMGTPVAVGVSTRPTLREPGSGSATRRSGFGTGAGRPRRDHAARSGRGEY